MNLCNVFKKLHVTVVLLYYDQYYTKTNLEKRPKKNCAFIPPIHYFLQLGYTILQNHEVYLLLFENSRIA